ncbi:helicase C-terminal domain-containing protein [Lactococcus insecticola]|uniref:DNA polymerase III polC-type n=1 Tax=Pseudolactococcus insecticola TaxID=2709158 RepID=A0A6A0B7V5_9LACT|nr:helicase C-terminal domain-containing protein [Lactococcus insecticola]GFH40743.1 3'-5' exonuclease [Lactococcus insecticola]
MTKYAVVDLEATSASHTSKIIQIGIAVVENGEITQTYQTDVNPHETLEYHITMLTGITTAQVKRAPDMRQVLDDVAAILRDSIFVAHNVKFDYNLLARTFSQYGRTLDMPRVDTVELARIFFPTLEKYGLETLSRVLNLEHDRPHEALSDAYATAKLLIKLQEKIKSLPKNVLAEIENHADNLIYETKRVITDSLPDAHRKHSDMVKVNNIATLKPVFSENKNQVKKNFRQNLKTLKLAHRPKQEQFADLIRTRLSDESASFIEAPTGIGKTYAYLLTLLGQGKKVIVSVPTKVLQDQMMIDLAPVFKSRFGVNFAKLLGTANYISLEKFSKLLYKRDEGKNFEIFKMKVLVWLTETTTGELDELSLTMTSQSYLKAIAHTGNVAQGQLHAEQEFYQLAQSAAKNAQVIVVNHAYLTERIADQTAFFDNKVLVVDEAQYLFSVLENAQQKSVKLLDELVKVNQHKSQLTKRLLESLTHQLSRRQLDVAKIRLDAEELGLTEITRVLDKPSDFVWIQNHVLTSSPEDFLNFSAMIPETTKTFLIGATLSMSEKSAIFPELLGFSDYTFDTITANIADNQQVFVATDAPDLTRLSPGDYAQFIGQKIQELRVLKKPLLVLFTSLDSLNLTANYLSELQIDFLQPDGNGDASRIKKKFDAQQHGILLGSKQFWEGVDFERQDEMLVLITRLPFTVPDDILIRKYAKRFKNPFYDFSVPLATLQLKQALGRVNRRASQKSTVIILDKRLAGKTYAKKMVKNLRKSSRLDFAKFDTILQQSKDFLI